MKELFTNTFTAALIASISFFISGNLLCWPGVALARTSQHVHVTTNVSGYGTCAELGVQPQAQWDNMKHNHLTMEETGWISICMFVGAFLSPVLTAYAVDTVGHKKMHLGCIIPFILSWVLLFIAHHIVVYAFSRFVAGIGMGMAYTMCPLYVSEISQPKSRGRVCNTMQIMLNLGIFYTSVGGLYTNTITLHVMHFVIIVVFFVLMCFMPESPAFLIMNGKDDLAEWELFRLRGTKNIEAVRKEFKEIKESLIMDMFISKHYTYKRKLEHIFRDDTIFNCLIIIVGVTAIQRVSGPIAFIAYHVTIMEKEVKTLSLRICSLLMCSVGVIVSILCLLFVDKVGRRPLLFISVIGICSAQLCMSAYFLFRENLQGVDWIILVIFMVYSAFYNIAVGPFINTMLGDLFSFTYKKEACALTAEFNFCSTVLLMKFYQTLDKLDQYLYFFIICLITLCSIPFLYFLLPETSNRTICDVHKTLSEKEHKLWVYHTNKNYLAVEEVARSQNDNQEDQRETESVISTIETTKLEPTREDTILKESSKRRKPSGEIVN